MKKDYVLLLPLLFWAASLSGEGSEGKQMRQAEVFFEDNESSQAVEQYQNLLQEPHAPWQRALLTYDLGSALMGEERWSQAIATFNSVSVDSDTSPLLLFRLKSQLAWAYWRQGLQAFKQQDMNLARQALQSALPEVTLAQQAHCLLTYAEGAPSCVPEPDLTALQAMIQKLLLSLPPPSASPKPPSSEEGSGKTETQNEKEKSTQEVLQFLLEMERDDASPSKAPSLKKGVQRPW